MLRLKRSLPAPLRLQFVMEGTPVEGTQVQATKHGCLWGPCSFTLGVTDEAGRLTVEDFYPDEIESVFVAGPGKARRWEADPRTMRPGWTTVTLSPR